MCGIAGLASVKLGQTALSRALDQMISAIGHRGPDDRGTHVATTEAAGRVGIGNTRLAILDPSSAGRQPFRDEETGACLVFNGEIYNHLDLRRELGNSVERWHSGSDTETVLRAYQVWGEDCLHRLRGMFAFALWNPSSGELWCARDRLGIKPFYYHQAGGTVAFASEVRALLASDLVPRTLDRTGLAGFVRFGVVPEPRTLVEGVRSLPAGSWLRVRNGRVVQQRSYWEPVVQPRVRPRDEATRLVREELERAVGEHLLSDVPVACFLSGGVDSSVVTALAAQASSRKLETFTLGLDDPTLDESEPARLVAEHCGTSHHLVRLTFEEIAAAVPEAVAAMDLPSADAINSYVVSKTVADAGFKVVLSGLGGDELFGGYRSFRYLHAAERLAPLLGRLPRSFLELAAGRSGRRQRALELVEREASLGERYDHSRAYWSTKQLVELGVQAVGLGGHDPGAPMAVPARLSALELTGYMRSTLLRDSDAMSMAKSLELRVPFLDHAFVELCLELEVAGAVSPRRNKPMLVDATQDLLPAQVFRRSKQGFVLPYGSWIRGPLDSFTRDGLAALDERGALPQVRGAELHQRFLAGELPWARLWQFVVLGHWLQANRIEGGGGS